MKSAPARRVVAAVVALAILAWASVRWNEARRAESFSALRSATPNQFLSTESLPRHSDAFLARARVRSEVLFPPDRAGAQTDLEAALNYSPLRSEAWLLLGRELALGGAAMQARVALRRAEALDPGYPAQRLRAIQLWSLLGDEESARATARRVAAFGGTFRRQAAEELMALGHEPIEVLSLLGGADPDPADQAAALLAVKPRSGIENEDLFARMPESAFADRSFRAAVFPRALSPFAPVALDRLWSAETPLTDFAPGLRMANPTLLDPPFALGLPVGWQPGPKGLQVTWQSPSVSGETFGSLEIATPLVPGSSSASLQYPFLRLPVPAGQAFVASAAVRSVPALGTNRLWLTVRGIGAQAVRSESMIPLETWGPLEVPVPAAAEPVLLELVLEGRLAASGGATPMVFLGPLMLRPAGGT